MHEWRAKPNRFARENAALGLVALNASRTTLELSLVSRTVS